MVLFVIAVVVYLTTRAIERRLEAGQGGQQRPPQRPNARPSRPVAPDDDPEFLRSLEWEKRKRDRAHPDKPEAPRPSDSDDSEDQSPEA